jgi:copper chaperone NosL
MIINEARFASAYITNSGETRRFDDIGGMVAYKDEVEEDVAVYWVHDFESEAWLKAEEAYYIESEQQTPMGFGIVAFGSEQRAKNWSEEQGGAMLTFEDLFN